MQELSWWTKRPQTHAKLKTNPPAKIKQKLNTALNNKGKDKDELITEQEKIPESQDNTTAQQIK